MTKRKYHSFIPSTFTVSVSFTLYDACKVSSDRKKQMFCLQANFFWGKIIKSLLKLTGHNVLFFLEPNQYEVENSNFHVSADIHFWPKWHQCTETVTENWIFYCILASQKNRRPLKQTHRNSSIYKTCIRLYRRRKPPHLSLCELCVTCPSLCTICRMQRQLMISKSTHWKYIFFLKQQCCVTEQFCYVQHQRNLHWGNSCARPPFPPKRKKKSKAVGWGRRWEMGADRRRFSVVWTTVMNSSDSYPHWISQCTLSCSVPWNTAERRQYKPHTEGIQTLH